MENIRISVVKQVSICIIVIENSSKQEKIKAYVFALDINYHCYERSMNEEVAEKDEKDLKLRFLRISKLL